MAIKNPNPNIKDFEVNDNTTWSSAHIAAGLQAAGVEVGSEGSFEHKKVSLLSSLTVDTAGTTFNFDVNAKFVLIVVDSTFTETTTLTTNIYLKTDMQSTYFTSGAFSTRSHTANTRGITLMRLSVERGFVDSYGTDAGINGYATITKSATEAFINNILANNITSVQVLFNNAVPVGTTIKIYGY